MSIDVKICGLRNAAGVKAAIEGGAHYIGFVFHPPSTRFIAAEDAAIFAEMTPPTVKRVGLFVGAKDEDIRTVLQKVPLDILQLHGNETPERVKAIRALTGLPVMKALRIATADDLRPVASFETVADYLLFDTRAGEEPTGGTGKTFDWNLLRGQKLTKPWMLAGGLNACNIAEAVHISGAKILDVSSGVEDAPGHKSPEKIRAFIAAAAKLA